MFSARNTETPNPFRPALQYLLSSTKLSRAHHRQSSSSSSTDTEHHQAQRMSSSLHPKSPSEFRSNSIPLISISRSPSPFQRRRSDSNPGSEATDEDDWGDYPSASRRSLLPADGYKLTGWKYFVYGGGFGQWLFTTPTGWTFYIGVLVIWLGGCQIGLTVMNRIVMWSAYLLENYTSHTKLMVLIAGVYKFNWPLTTALIEMLMTHCWILLSAYITRWTSPWLVSAGVSSMVAPSKPLPKSTQGGFRGMQKNGGGGILGTISRWTSNFSGGIAGGGLFEMEWAVAKQVLPLAIIFIAKVSLSNLSFAYAELQIYTLARIAIVPFSLIFTSTLNGTSHSVTTLSSTLTATLTLLIALSRTSMRAAWEAIVAGVFSSIFVALYPVQIQRTYKSLVASLVPQGELIGTFPSASTPADYSGSREETRAYWRLLHYTSTLSILIFIPIVILSGELTDISRNCYFLDLFWPWLMIPIDHDVPVCTQSGIFVADHGWVQITSVRLDWDWHVLVVLWVVSDGEEEGGEIG
ncbi:hypothetical protein GLAREA_01181 [Glarea lozoyensis ATCC 20868]|uniref:Uncharacterized protein n=1 Tax=Glarea lozoyensis (strain ATCC 20868 / MF5171) TaxID=1116229 RepID=S3CJ66_GLAL2|nr:uncharacterized protein GLAREA_01181 [Glarea lozoyensis ATCC 20868]EPE25269.1 hypothetical protein GLAREA_01181 [Glarea lozoyensis ATCC 20868]